MRIISLVFIWLTLSGFDLNQNQIRIVGSSTLYPFVTIAAEYFAKKHNYTTPIVESIGTGAGMKLFCSGDSLKYPDIVNASRKIKESEINYCHKNKVLNIQEINLGYDGVILAHSVNAKDLNLSPSSLYKALAKYIVENGKIINNPNKFWDDIDPNLEHSKIEIFGPAYGSGTRDALTDIILVNECINQIEIKHKYPEIKERIVFCSLIREDGGYIESNENDNIIISKLIQNKNALGLISFHYLASNDKNIKAAKINKVYPTTETIINQGYILSRPLFLYFNKDHYFLRPELKQLAEEITTREYIGENGILTKNGLISNFKEKLNKQK